MRFLLKPHSHVKKGPFLVTCLKVLSAIILKKPLPLKLIKNFSWYDHLASWNIFSGMYENYKSRISVPENLDNFFNRITSTVKADK